MWRVKRESVECLLAGAPALAICIWWIFQAGGYFERVWMPGAVLLLVVGATSAIATRQEIGVPSRAARLALAALAAYVAWSFASILWAGAPGDALEGSQRTLLYLACFALFAVLPWTPRTLIAAVAVFAIAVAAAGATTLARMAGDTPLPDLFIQARLAAPLGYHNAGAALWTMAAVPALMLAAGRELASWLRPVVLASSTLLLGLALLTASRGWLFTLPVVVIAAVGLSPDRLRLALFALPALGGVTLAAPDLLEINRLGADLTPTQAQSTLRPAVDAAVASLTLVTAAVLVAGIALVVAEHRLADRWALGSKARRLVSIVLAGSLVAGGSAAGLVATGGDPVGRVKTGWAQFTQVDARHGGGGESRFTSVGGERYDIWRVAVAAWAQRPLLGLGQDNFGDAYMTRRRSTFEETRWTHGLPLRVLAHTGLVGACLLLAFAAAVAFAAAAAVRDGLPGRAAAGAALIPAVVWTAHGAVDWLWEFPALSGAALAFLGAVVALGRGDPAEPERARAHPRSARAQRAIVAAAAAAILAGGALLVPSFVADNEVSVAEQGWRDDPAGALGRLERARSLNPLAVRPWLVEGLIHEQRGDFARALAAFAQAAEHAPKAWYPRFALGLAASAAGDRARARRELRAAQARNPRDPVIADAIRRLASRPLTFDEARRRLAARLRLRRNEFDAQPTPNASSSAPEAR